MSFIAFAWLFHIVVDFRKLLSIAIDFHMFHLISICFHCFSHMFTDSQSCQWSSIKDFFDFSKFVLVFNAIHSPECDCTRQNAIASGLNNHDNIKPLGETGKSNPSFLSTPFTPPSPKQGDFLILARKTATVGHMHKTKLPYCHYSR